MDTSKLENRGKEDNIDAGGIGFEEEKQKMRRKKYNKIRKEKRLTSPGSETEHLVAQEELSEGIHSGITNLAGSKTKIALTKPSPHLVGGRS